MKFIPAFLLYLFSAISVFSQQIQVLNEVTEEPVSDVAVYTADKRKSAVTDFDGYVDISHFSENDKIIFQHTSYSGKVLLKSKILQNKIVLLQPEEGKLAEVILSVSRFAQEKEEIPQSVITIGKGEILFRNPQTAADLLDNSGKIFVQKSQLGGGSPMIRGFSTNRLLMTVDGIRMNTAIFRSGNLHNVISLDPFLVKNTEVVLGPGSVIYGSDALGGVMNFYTLSPKFFFGKGSRFSGNAVVRYATANKEKTTHADFNFGTKQWAFLSSITYSDFDDLRMGSHGPEDYLRGEYVARVDGEDMVVQNPNPLIQVSTGYDQYSLAQKIRFMPGEVWDFNLNLLYSATSDFPRYDRLNRRRNGQLRSAEWYYGPQVWFSGNLQVEKIGKGPFYDKLKISSAYQRFEESRNDRDFGSSDLFHTEEKVDAYSASLDFNKKQGDLNLFYGLDYVYNKVGSSGEKINIGSGETQPTPSRYPDGSTWESIAGYASLHWKISDKVSLQSGLRYNHFKVFAEFDDLFFDFPFETADISTGNISGGTGITWQPNETLSWRANFSTAFRAPNIDDVGKIFDSEPGSVVVPNPDLKAEYSYNGELGTSLNFEKTVIFDLAIFYTILDNALVRRDYSLNGQTEIIYQGESSNVQAIQNAAEARSYGFEAGVEIKFSETLRLISQYTITDGYEEEEDGSKVPLRHAPPQFGNTRFIWENSKFKAEAYARYSGAFDFEDLAPSEANKPGIYASDSDGNPYSPSWYTLNLTSQYEITDHWQATASLENITDRRYRTYSSGITAPGRNFILALKYAF